MLKTIFFYALITAAFASAAFAQSDEYNKIEFFGGYSINRVDLGADANQINRELGGSRNFQGFEASVTGNVSKYVGVKFDVSGHYKDFAFNVPGVANQPRVEASLYNFLGGVQIKNNSKARRVQPFVHALAGAARTRAKLNDAFCRETLGTVCPAEFQDAETGFAAALGAGLDVKVNKRFSLRVAQVDYNPVWSGGERENNVRFGFGIVLH